MACPYDSFQSGSGMEGIMKLPGLIILMAGEKIQWNRGDIEKRFYA